MATTQTGLTGVTAVARAVEDSITEQETASTHHQYLEGGTAVIMVPNVKWSTATLSHVQVSVV